MHGLVRSSLLLLITLAIVRSNVHGEEVAPAPPEEEDAAAEDKPLMAHSNHILVETEAEADAIMDQLATTKANILVTFAELAMEKSKCPSGKDGGDLGWFPRGRMVAAFDDVVFDREPRHVYKVHTDFGWHVVYTIGFGDGEPEVDEYRTVKLWANRVMPFIGPIILIIIMTCGQRAANKPIGPMARASHILVDKEEDADTLLHEIVAAKDPKEKLAELAKTHSKCRSKTKGGDLGVFGKGQMVPPFEKVAFEEEIGSVHKVQTKFGWHVVMVTDRYGEKKEETKETKELPKKATKEDQKAKKNN